MGFDPIQPLLLDFAPDATLDDFAEALRAILGRAGCPGCGRLSVHIRAVDDPELKELREISSLRTVLELGPQVAVSTATSALQRA